MPTQRSDFSSPLGRVRFAFFEISKGHNYSFLTSSGFKFICLLLQIQIRQDNLDVLLDFVFMMHSTCIPISKGRTHISTWGIKTKSSVLHYFFRLFSLENFPLVQLSLPNNNWWIWQLTGNRLREIFWS